MLYWSPILSGADYLKLKCCIGRRPAGRPLITNWPHGWRASSAPLRTSPYNKYNSTYVRITSITSHLRPVFKASLTCSHIAPNCCCLSQAVFSLYSNIFAASKFSCKFTIFKCCHLKLLRLCCLLIADVSAEKLLHTFISSLFRLLFWAFVFLSHISPVIVGGWLVVCYWFLVVDCRLSVVC